MKFDILDVFYVFLVIYNLFSTVRLIFNVLKGNMLLNKARKNGEIIIKGNNSVYSVKNYIIAIIMEAIFVFILCSFLIYYRIHPVLAVPIVITTATLAASMVIHIIAIFKEKYVYLTNSGLIYFLGCFEFSKCRFAWETSSTPDIPSDTLHVYKPKVKFPFTVSFDSDIEAAHKITDEHISIIHNA